MNPVANPQKGGRAPCWVPSPRGLRVGVTTGAVTAPFGQVTVVAGCWATPRGWLGVVLLVSLVVLPLIVAAVAGALAARGLPVDRDGRAREGALIGAIAAVCAGAWAWCFVAASWGASWGADVGVEGRAASEGPLAQVLGASLAGGVAAPVVAMGALVMLGGSIGRASGRRTRTTSIEAEGGVHPEALAAGAAVSMVWAIAVLMAVDVSWARVADGVGVAGAQGALPQGTGDGVVIAFFALQAMTFVATVVTIGVYLVGASAAGWRSPMLLPGAMCAAAMVYGVTANAPGLGCVVVVAVFGSRWAVSRWGQPRPWGQSHGGVIDAGLMAWVLGWLFAPVSGGGAGLAAAMVEVLGDEAGAEPSEAALRGMTRALVLRAYLFSGLLAVGASVLAGVSRVWRR